LYVFILHTQLQVRSSLQGFLVSIIARRAIIFILKVDFWQFETGECRWQIQYIYILLLSSDKIDDIYIVNNKYIIICIFSIISQSSDIWWLWLRLIRHSAIKLKCMSCAFNLNHIYSWNRKHTRITLITAVVSILCPGHFPTEHCRCSE